MNTLFLAMLLAGTSAAEATPSAPLVAVPVAITQTTPAQAPMSKAEMKRRRKLRRQNGPEVYKGSVAEQNRVITDAAGSEKEDGEAATRRKERKNKKN